MFYLVTNVFSLTSPLSRRRASYIVMLIIVYYYNYRFTSNCPLKTRPPSKISINILHSNFLHILSSRYYSIIMKCVILADIKIVLLHLFIFNTITYNMKYFQNVFDILNKVSIISKLFIYYAI